MVDSEVTINQIGELQERSSLALTAAAAEQFGTGEALEWIRAQTLMDIQSGAELYFVHLFANAHPASSREDFYYFGDRRMELERIIKNLFDANQAEKEKLLQAFGRFAYQNYTGFLYQSDNHSRVNPIFLKTEISKLFSDLVHLGLIEEDISVPATSYFSDRQEGVLLPELLKRYLAEPEVLTPIDFNEERRKPPVEELLANIDGQETKLKVTRYISGVAEGNIYLCEAEDGRRFALKVFEVEKMEAEAAGKPYNKRGPEELRDNDKLKIDKENRVVVEEMDYSREYLWKIETMFSGPALAVIIDELLKKRGYRDHLVVIHDYGTLDRKSHQHRARGWLEQDSSPYIVMDYRPEMAEGDVPQIEFRFYASLSPKVVGERLRSGELPDLTDEETEKLIKDTIRQESRIHDISINEGILLVDANVLLLRSGQLWIFDTSVSKFVRPPEGALLERLIELQNVFYGLALEKSRVFYQAYKPNGGRLRGLIDQSSCNAFWMDQEKKVGKKIAKSGFDIDAEQT